MNSETQILLQYWDFRSKKVDEAWCLLKRVTRDSFEFEKASRFYGNSFHDPCVFHAKSYYTPPWCDMCNSSVHNVSSCPYYAYYAHSDLSLPLNQSMRLEVGVPFGLVLVLA